MTVTNPEAMRILTRGDVRRALADVDVVGAVESALRAHHAGHTLLPSEAYMPWTNDANDYCRSLAMLGGISDDVGTVLGMKLINASVGNPTRGMPRAGGFSALFDPTTGRPTMLAEGALVSALRTAAYTVASMRALGPTQVERMAIVGCGHLAHVHAELVRRYLPGVTSLDLYDVRREAADRLAAAWRAALPTGRASVHPDVRSAVALADVIVCLTTSDRPYIPRAWLPRTGLVAHVSLDDLQDDVFGEAAAVYVDDVDLVTDNPRRILGRLLAEQRTSLTGTLGAVLAGDQSPASADSALVISNPFGMAILDVALLRQVEVHSVRLDLGIELDLTSEGSLTSIAPARPSAHSASAEVRL